MSGQDKLAGDWGSRPVTSEEAKKQQEANEKRIRELLEKSK